MKRNKETTWPCVVCLFFLSTCLETAKSNKTKGMITEKEKGGSGGGYEDFFGAKPRIWSSMYTISSGAWNSVI